MFKGTGMYLTEFKVPTNEAQKNIQKENTTYQAIQKKIRQSYYQEIKPMLRFLNIFGRFPYNITESGVLPFKLWSIANIYSIIAYFVQVLYTIFVMEYLYYNKLQPHKSFDEYLSGLLFIGVLLINLFIPVVNWLGAPKLLKYIKAWQVFEMTYTKSGLTLRANRLVRYYSYALLPVAGSMTHAVIYFTAGENIIISGIFIPIAVNIHFDIVVWMATHYEIRVLVRALAGQMISDSRLDGMEQKRQKWLSICRLTNQSGSAFSNSILTFFLCYFFIIVLASYCFIYKVLHLYESNGNLGIGYLWAVLLGLTYVYTITATARYTMDAVGKEFTFKILSMDMTYHTHKYKVQLNRFLATVKNNPPKVDLSGILEVDKPLILSVYSRTVTMLIVLLQYKI